MQSSMLERVGRASARIFVILIVGRLVLEASRLDALAGVSEVLFALAVLLAAYAGFVLLRAMFPGFLPKR